MDIKVRVDHFFHHGSDSELALVNDKLDQLIQLGGISMARGEELRAVIEQINVATNDISASIQKAVKDDAAKHAEYQAQIDALKAKVAAGEAVSAEDLQVFDELRQSGEQSRANLQQAAEALKAIGSDPNNPVPGDGGSGDGTGTPSGGDGGTDSGVPDGSQS